MKKLAFSWLIIFLLFFSLTKAQMSYKPIDLSINTPQETNVYKKYTEGKTFLGLSFGTAIPFGDYGSSIYPEVGGNISPGIGLGIQAHYFINDHFAFIRQPRTVGESENNFHHHRFYCHVANPTAG